MPRLFKNSFLSLLLIFAAQKLCAQYMTADNFFDSGAQLYISNNIPAALKQTENGLKAYPNDEKLQKLEKLLKQQQQSQQNQQKQNQQNQKNQKSNSQQNKSQQQKNSQSQNQQQQNQANQQKQQSQKQQQEQSKQSQEKSSEEKKEQANAMTPKEAKQLLDSQKGDEQFLTLKPKEKPPENNQPIKDW